MEWVSDVKGDSFEKRTDVEYFFKSTGQWK